MYECPHDNKLLEGRAGGIFCRGCGTLFKSFAEIHPKEDDDPTDNGNGEADNETLTETETPEGTNTEPTVTDDDPEEETPPAENEPAKPSRRGRPKKENADND